MTSKHQHGKSESRWLSVRRCLAIVRRLQQGPAHKKDLLAAVFTSEGKEAYGLTDGIALTKRFEADKRRLRDHLGIDLRYDAAASGYVIAETAIPLLNLPDDDLATIAWLSDTFQSDSPHTNNVHRFIDRIVNWLPNDRQKQLEHMSGTLPAADLRLRDDEPIPGDVWKAVLAAYRAKQELTFDYQTSGDDEVKIRQHHVQPWRVELTDRGHWRLQGYCLFCDSAAGPQEPRDYRHYRLSRIVSGSVRVLPRKLPPIRPVGKPRRVVFEMSPRIARFGVSARRELIDEPQITPMANGWVRVEGRTLDVFDLARNLLYYGGNCRVLGGPELLAEMRGLVDDLAALYRTPAP
jgi:predicted DNA-binding transcriptional regulator YafY